jgi:hypothetical protein
LYVCAGILILQIVCFVLHTPHVSHVAIALELFHYVARWVAIASINEPTIPPFF